MTRTKFRKFWLASLAVMMGTAMYCHGKYEEVGLDVDRTVRKIDKLAREKRAGNSVTAFLADLDSRTIQEKNATRLKILEYLGLQQSNLNVQIGASNERRMGPTKLVTRDVMISGRLPYEEALNQLDYFYNAKKVSISFVSVTPVKDAYGDMTNFQLKGVIYGLLKK